MSNLQLLIFLYRKLVLSSGRFWTLKFPEISWKIYVDQKVGIHQNNYIATAEARWIGWKYKKLYFSVPLLKSHTYQNFICLCWRGSAASSLLGLRVRIPPEHGYLSLVSVVCCPVEVSASGWSLIQRSPTACGVSERNREASIMRRPWPTRGCCAIKKKSVCTCSVFSLALFVQTSFLYALCPPLRAAGCSSVTLSRGLRINA